MYFKEFKIEIETYNEFGLFDINKLSEEFSLKLLNIIFHRENINLERLELIKHDYPAIDLGDLKTKIAYQITSQNDVQKITETINKFIETDDFKNGKYIDLRFLILSDRECRKRSK
jgi:hypothetical protein